MGTTQGGEASRVSEFVSSSRKLEATISDLMRQPKMKELTELCRSHLILVGKIKASREGEKLVAFLCTGKELDDIAATTKVAGRLVDLADVCKQ